MNLFGKNTNIGIDISDSSIEVLQLSSGRDVIAYGRINLEEGIVKDGRILNKEKLIRKIQEVLMLAKSKHLTVGYSINALFSLPESKVFIHLFKLPKNLFGESLKEAIKKESSRLIPLSQDKIYWDFYSFRPSLISPDSKDFQFVLYVGSPREIVDDYLNILKQAKVNPLIFDVETASLARSLIKENNKGVVIVDIGARTTNIGVFSSTGILNLSATIPMAGNYFTKKISEELKVNNEEAERLKVENGFSEKKSNKVLPILINEFERIIKEIKQAIDYYESQRSDKIEEIILAGGSSLLPDIERYLSQSIGRKVSIGNPLQNINKGNILQKENNPIFFANVVGLALRGASNAFNGINLLRQIEQQKLEDRKKKYHIFVEYKNKILELLWDIRNKNLLTSLFIAVSFIIFVFVIYQYVINTPLPASIISEEENQEVAIPDLLNEALNLSSSTKPLIQATSTTSTPLSATTSSVTIINKIIIQETPTGWLNVRTGPGINYQQIARVYINESYQLLKEEGDWFQIKISDKISGWILSQYAKKIID